MTTQHHQQQTVVVSFYSCVIRDDRDIDRIEFLDFPFPSISARAYHARTAGAAVDGFSYNDIIIIQTGDIGDLNIILLLRTKKHLE